MTSTTAWRQTQATDHRAEPACECVECIRPTMWTATLTDKAATRLSAGFAALADPVRLKLVNLLATAPSGAACVCDLIVPAGKSQATVSHHLKVLAEAGVIVGDRQGRRTSYRLRPERVAALKNALTKAPSK